MRKRQNRIIKFRAWDGKKMVYQSVIASWPHESEEWVKENGFINKSNLLQFTGLLDKNGKEIYEGDIVERPNGGNPGLVRWFDGGYWGVDVSGDYCGYMFDCNHPENHEVIGNIYDGKTSRIETSTQEEDEV